MKYGLGGADTFESWIINDLLLKGNARIDNLNNKRSIQKIKYVFLEDLLGGETGQFYEPSNKKSFFYHVIALGE
jgi:hypothetical protein